MSRTINLAVIPGDGIGTEVVGEGLKVLDVVAAKYGVTFNKTHYDLGLVTGIAQVKFFQIQFWQSLLNLMSFCLAQWGTQAFQAEFWSADYCSSFALPLIITSTFALRS